MPLRFHEIETLTDPLYDAWLDLYQTAFPLNEQLLVSSHNQALRRREQSGASDRCYLAAIDADNLLAGMALYQLKPQSGTAVLWYLAVRETSRGNGLGAAIYQEIVSRLRQAPGCSGLLFEVERPDEAHSDAERALALRRIAFYRRNGATLLEGVRYMQSVGWQPPVRMDLMVHPFEERGPTESFMLARSTFGHAVVRDQ